MFLNEARAVLNAEKENIRKHGPAYPIVGADIVNGPDGWEVWGWDKDENIVMKITRK